MARMINLGDPGYQLYAAVFQALSEALERAGVPMSYTDRQKTTDDALKAFAGWLTSGPVAAVAAHAAWGHDMAEAAADARGEPCTHLPVRDCAADRAWRVQRALAALTRNTHGDTHD